MQVLDPLEATRLNVNALYDELDGDKNPSAKDLLRYLRRKDLLIGGGQHHVRRRITRGQIMGDLRRWLEDHPPPA